MKGIDVLNKLPSPIKEEAIMNSRDWFLDGEADTELPSEAIQYAFLWYNTKQGESYWRKIQAELKLLNL